MIISKTPYRISFFGGGTDYPSWYKKNGGFVISATIDKYIYISCRTLPPFFKHKYRIVWSKIETVKNLNKIKHKVVRTMIKKYKIKKGLEIHYDGDLPARSGMGSSSVFVVGLMNLLNNFREKKINKYRLAKESIYFEQKILNEIVGSQDQVASSYGGFNKITFNKEGFKVLMVGEGGDEVLAGYNRMYIPYLFNIYIRNKIKIPEFVKKNISIKIGKKFNLVEKILKYYPNRLKKLHDI